ncbi:MAG: sugar ABC transporter ATP-binding protein [Thermoprotei archaeon]|nr:MAG: sugar ABC transporter ATP-binding protein [Thermoprotei archaeon]
MVSVKLDKVSKYFGKVKAVDEVTLHVKDGEFVTLLGPSGCGKTTTLLMIAGIYKPTKGRIYFDEMDVTEIPPKDRNVGMVFQSYALYPHMTVYNNIAFPLKLKKVPRNEIDRKVKEVAKLLKIDHLLDRKPAQLSGGQQQRVALARALVKEPDVLLLDEPLSNLDALLRVYMRAELKRLQKTLGITAIYVTHDQVEALSMSDRIVVMKDGKIQQIGSPDEIYSKPSNTFVANFIGTPPMNLIPCRVVEGKTLECPGFKYVMKDEIAEKILKDHEEVYFGIRPEDIIISNKDESDVEAHVLVVEPIGRDLVLTIQLEEEYTIKVLAPPSININPGSKIYLKFRKEKIHLFDKKTGQRIEYIIKKGEE